MQAPIDYESSQKFLDNMRKALHQEYNREYSNDELRKIAIDLIHAFATVM